MVGCVLGSVVTASGSFDQHGVEVLEGDFVYAANPYPGGRILLYGQFTDEWGFLRLLPDGSADTSFGQSGFRPASFLNSFDIQPDGKILLIGTGPEEPVVTRLDRDGSLDRSFGDEGVAKIDFGRRVDHGQSVSVAPGGKIVVGGSSATFEESRSGASDAIAAFARLLPDGRLDRSFSGDGLAFYREAEAGSVLGVD